MPIELHRVEGVSERKDVWWDDGHQKFVSCPKCGDMNLYREEVLHCLGCGKRTEIVLKD